MTPPQPGPASAAGLASAPGISSGGVLGGRPLMAQTLHGGDPDTVAAPAICEGHPDQVPGPHAALPGRNTRA